MALKQPLNAGLPRRAPTPYDSRESKGWQRFYMIALTVSASALLATLVTFGVLNFLLNDVELPPLPNQQAAMAGLPGMPLLEPTSAQQAGAILNSSSGNGSRSQPTPAPTVVAQAPVLPPAPAKWVHPLKHLEHYYTLPPQDTSPRCKSSQICDGDHSCGPDSLGCITAAKDRQDHVRKAIAWSWEGYRKYAWGHDEVNSLSKSAHPWFNLGLTIVDSLDTLLIAGLQEEYQQARHWVANHLQFNDGSSVQFFEVNIRILGGLLSAYYLSDGDDMYLNKATMMADRLMVAFNTSSGIPYTFVQLAGAAQRAASGRHDAVSNQAEAGTISMEFTTIGRLLGRDDMFDAGNQFWYVLMTSQNFSGLYCMGIHTSNGGCSDPKMTIGSAADSMYEYMLKQWLLSSKTQEVPLMLYKEAAKGVRKYLLRHIFDGTANMSFVSEATANQATGQVSRTNDRFEHLTCFAGGMYVLGKMHNLTTTLSENDYDDGEVGARIGKACYEMYHQAASGVAPDSIMYEKASGGALPPNEEMTPHLAPPKIRTPRKRKAKAKPQQQAPAQAAAQPAGNAPKSAADTAGAAHPQPSTSVDMKQVPQHGVQPDVKRAPKPEDTADQQEKPGQAKRAPKPEEAQVTKPEVVKQAPKPQEAQGVQKPGGNQPAAAAGQPAGEVQHAPTTRRLMGDHQASMSEAGIDEAALDEDVGEIAATTPEGQGAEQAQAEQWQQQELIRSMVQLQQQRQQQLEEADSNELSSEQGAAAAEDGEGLLYGPARHLMADGIDETSKHPEEGDDDATSEAAGSPGTAGEPSAPDADADKSPEDDNQQDDQQEDSQEDEGVAAAAAAAPASPPPPPPSPPPPPPPPSPPPPPPPGPVVASWKQLSQADFLRPEAIETLFYLWRATGDEIYREWGWNMFRAFERWCRLPSGGYATLSNVNSVPPQQADKMESFWLAETLKYFYLLFEDDPTVLPLDQWVFNTEAHPLPMWGTPPDKKMLDRLKKRRYAQMKEKKRREAEEAALKAQEQLVRETEAARQQAPKGKPQDREGYGLAGLI